MKQAILPKEMSTEELIKWLEGFLRYNDTPEDFYYMDEDLLNEIIRRLREYENRGKQRA